MARITVEDCIDKFPSRFELVLVASHRAKKLHSGDEPEVDRDNDKNTVVALREIADSKFTVEQMKENLIQEYQTITISDEEEENLEIESIDPDNKDKESEEDHKDLDIKAKEIEEEIGNLSEVEEKEIAEQFEITDNLEENITSENENTLLDEKPVE